MPTAGNAPSPAVATTTGGTLRDGDAAMEMKAETATRGRELDTPCVTILLDRLEKNIDRVQRMVESAWPANRPHIKTHKIPAIAAMQMKAGAAGITCQKLGEAEVFADAGVADDILITFNIVGGAKTGRLMDLAERVARLSVVADNETVLAGLSAPRGRRGRELPVLIECDSGFGRNGVQTPGRGAGAGAARRTAARAAFRRADGVSQRCPSHLDFFNEAIRLFEVEKFADPRAFGRRYAVAEVVGGLSA